MEGCYVTLACYTAEFCCFVCQWFVATVETHYNAVLGVHRSDPRYIRIDGHNAVFPPPTPPTNDLY